MGLYALKGKRTNVTTAGTRVQLMTTEAYGYDLVIKAHVANTGLVYIGDVTVAAAVGYALDPGKEIRFTKPDLDDPEQRIDLTKIYVDSAVNGEGVSACWMERTP